MALLKSKTPEYQAYQDAKSRCRNVNHRLWKYYGKRGIEFKFNSFEEFINILGKRPDNLSLDRIDNNGHYEVGNVRWATKSEQVFNRRSWKRDWREANEKAKSYVITFPNGTKEKIFNMAKFCRENGLQKSNLHKTINNNWTHHGFKAQIV